jgi:hypothetical protein
MKVFCISIFNENYKLFKSLNLIPVGLGKKKYSKNWLIEKEKNNISAKNEFYGEYTFHYYLWKNNIIKNNYSSWIGFCTYRRFWKKKDIKNPANINELKKKILLKIPKEWKKYESILVEPIFMKKLKKIKILKNGFWEILKNPAILFKKKFNIEDQFNLFHGSKYLKIGIELLEENEKVDFAQFLKKNNFNPYNMFFCKNYKILERYYESVFSWLSRIESVIGFKNLDGYGKKRIYAFLAERYCSYWFQKYTRSHNWPITFLDTKQLSK